MRVEHQFSRVLSKKQQQKDIQQFYVEPSFKIFLWSFLHRKFVKVQPFKEIVPNKFLELDYKAYSNVNYSEKIFFRSILFKEARGFKKRSFKLILNSSTYINSLKESSFLRNLIIKPFFLVKDLPESLLKIKENFKKKASQIEVPLFQNKTSLNILNKKMIINRRKFNSLFKRELFLPFLSPNVSTIAKKNEMLTNSTYNIQKYLNNTLSKLNAEKQFKTFKLKIFINPNTSLLIKETYKQSINLMEIKIITTLQLESELIINLPKLLHQLVQLGYSRVSSTVFPLSKLEKKTRSFNHDVRKAYKILENKTSFRSKFRFTNFI